jgi:hypothetical protein
MSTDVPVNNRFVVAHDPSLKLCLQNINPPFRIRKLDGPSPPLERVVIQKLVNQYAGLKHGSARKAGTPVRKFSDSLDLRG